MGLYLVHDAEHKGGGSRPRLLIAVRPEDVALSREILGDEFDAVFCHSYEEACAHLDAGIRLVSCGVHFDNGKVFDLLRHVRENPETANLPFFIMLGAGSRYSPAIVQGIRAAAKLLKATAFTDLTRFADKVGNDASIASLRQGIKDAIAAQSPAVAARSTAGR
jgi:hypothetical protein